MSRETLSFQAEVNQLLSLVVNSLYSNKEIFLRELVSNASDALDKLKFQALTDKALTEGDDASAQTIRIVPDAQAQTIVISDGGIGMSRDELVQNLGTIAHSGTRNFFEAAKAASEGERPALIGQFGVGFYSAFLVADHVEVTSRAAGSTEAFRWISDAQGTFSIEPAERATRGTSVTLHLKESETELANGWKLRDLVRRYSDYVSHPIEMPKDRYGDDKDEADTAVEFETVNQARALWQRPKADITDEQYNEFYKHITHDFEPPLARTHFRIEGNQVFAGLLFVPSKAPHDLFMRDHRRGVRLYVKRVFIMDDCEVLVPEWLRFMRGIVDSDDLPLNVSRELLQDSGVTRTIKKQLVKKSIDLLEDLAANKPEDYDTFWKAFGAVVKEGFHYEPEHKDRLSKLVRWESSRGPGLVSLAEYAQRMPEGQKSIYYLTAESKGTVARSPHTEALRKRGFEVLYMTDPVDEWVGTSIQEFEGKPLVSAAAADLELESSDDEKKAHSDKTERFKDLTAAVQSVLTDSVKEVRLSNRLTDSPCCLVVPEGGISAHIERLLRQHDKDAPQSKRILELNADHALVSRLETVHVRHGDSERFREWVEVLYDQALLAEGSPIADATRFAQRVCKLLDQAVATQVEG